MALVDRLVLDGLQTFLTQLAQDYFERVLGSLEHACKGYIEHQRFFLEKYAGPVSFRYARLGQVRVAPSSKQVELVSIRSRRGEQARAHCPFSLSSLHANRLRLISNPGSLRRGQRGACHQGSARVRFNVLCIPVAAAKQGSVGSSRQFVDCQYSFARIRFAASRFLLFFTKYRDTVVAFAGRVRLANDSATLRPTTDTLIYTTPRLSIRSTDLYR